MKKRKLIYKIFSYLIVLIIFFLLVRVLIGNWQKVKDYDFSFNYFYLLISFFFLFSVIVAFGLVWNKILRILEPDKKLSNFKALKIFIYSWFGRYLPGKAWTFIGRIYLAQKEGLGKKPLIISTIYEIILSIASSFLFSLFLLGISIGTKLSDFYILSLIAVSAGLVFVHPKVFNGLVNFLLKKINKIELPLTDFLSYRRIIQIIFYYFIIYSLNGLGFFFLVRSLTFLPFCDIMGIMGSFVLASVLGIVAIFAPSGLGVREGALVVFLQFYFPISIAVLISLMARIWATLGEVIIFIVIYLYSKLKKI